MITAAQRGSRQFDTPVSFKNYQVPSKPPSAARVKLRAQNFGLNGLLEKGEYVCDVGKVVNANNWDKLCEFHEIIKQNHHTFDETEQKQEIDAALYHLRSNLYHWLIESKDKEARKVKKEKLTKGFIYQVLSLDYSFAQQCARKGDDPNSPFLSKFNWRNLTNISDVKDYTPSIKLQYEPLPKDDITNLSEELEDLREELEESDSETSVSDTEFEETETRALEAEKESRARKRKSRCSASDHSNYTPTSKKRKAQIIETDSDSDADNAYVNSVTASDTKNSLTTSNEKQSALKISRPISPQVPAPVKPQNKVYDVVELDVDQLLEQAIDKKPSIVRSPADTSESPDSLKKWLDSIGKLKEEFNESMELNELTEVNKSLWNSILELVELVNAQNKSINMYQLFLKKMKLHFQVPYFKSVREDERLQKKYSYLLEQYISLYVKYNELRADHAELEDEDNEACKALNIDMQDLMAQVSEAIEELNVYKKETIETQEELQRLELQTEVEKRQKLQKDYDELVKKYQSAQQTEKANSKLSEDLKLAHKKLAEDNKRRKNAEGKINELKLETKQLKELVRKIHSESYDKQAACNKAEKEFTQTETVLTKANEEAEAKILHLKEQNAELQQRSETLENEKRRLESELDKIRNAWQPRFYQPL